MSRDTCLERAPPYPLALPIPWGVRLGLKNTGFLSCCSSNMTHRYLLDSPRETEAGARRGLLPVSSRLPPPTTLPPAGCAPLPGSTLQLKGGGRGLEVLYPPELAKPGNHERKTQRERPRPPQRHGEKQVGNGKTVRTK